MRYVATQILERHKNVAANVFIDPFKTLYFETKLARRRCFSEGSTVRRCENRNLDRPDNCLLNFGD